MRSLGTVTYGIRGECVSFVHDIYRVIECGKEAQYPEVETGKNVLFCLGDVRICDIFCSLVKFWKCANFMDNVAVGFLAAY